MDFLFISGDVALDYAGTVAHRRTDHHDLLTSPAELARWSVASGLVAEPPEVDAAAFAEAIDLREAIYRLAFARQAGVRTDGTDRALVNAVAAGVPTAVALTAAGEVHRVGGIDAVLATLARAAVELLGGPLAPSIKECVGGECTRLYVDGSRRGTRRWCDMRECGNRAKAAAFRARTR
ncbi:CGNR zinc finger domain-containing protein [Pseudonocardia sp. TRM90224]|uniref:CGNR zinc finger domain-containing protein n=1 Tax=Pseudonocardia sp. TRM90224 TaxID=2812678 RepID=UPI001E2A07FC|nr:CGNR zinc finger domain-containing protein [Pseudonocardia sp. TRM90224]